MTDACSQFIAELREIAAETQFEFSQSDWEDALIDGFKHDWSLARVLLRAARVPYGRSLSAADWSALSQRAAALAPSLSPRTARSNLLRPWLAKNARFANNALWDLDYTKAKRLLKKGGRATDHVRDAAREIREAAGGLTSYTIPLRELSKKHDWNTVK